MELEPGLRPGLGAENEDKSCSKVAEVNTFYSRFVFPDQPAIVLPSMLVTGSSHQASVGSGAGREGGECAQSTTS